MINLLKEETKELREDFIKLYCDFNKREWDSVVRSGDFKLEANSDGIERWFRNTVPKTRAKDRYLVKWLKILRNGLDKFLDNSENDAISYYESSINKLSIRLTKMGVSKDSIIKLKSSYMDTNISTYIHTKDRVYNAYPIITAGEVQRPHYRYLIK